VTEIPEHLLKRSRERRAAAGGDAGDAGAAAATPSATPAVATPATPASPAAATPAPPAPAPKPDPAYVRAAKERRRMPFWAMGALGLLPVWAFMYLRGMQPVEEVVEGPLAVGEAAYTGCQSCHSANGSGGAGRPLWQGEVLTTFPKIEDMLNLVYVGSEQYDLQGIGAYGDPNREGGAHTPGSYNGNYMPAQGASHNGSLTDAQILGVVCHERYTIGGAEPTDEEYAEEYETWCSPESEIFLALEDGSMTFATPELGIGTEPRPSAP
jgi:mono/diheme cytochrome c family protein